MNEGRPSLRVALALAVLCLSCDGFGRALVGETQDSHPRETRCNAAPTGCEGAAPSFAPLLPPAAPRFELASCGHSAVACGASSGPNQSVFGCDLALTLGTTVEAPSLSCARATLTVPADLSRVTLPDLQIAQSELYVVATSPVTLELASASMEHVRIELRGPITLRLDEDSAVLDTQIVDRGHAASFELSESRAEQLSLLELAGRASIVRSALSATQLFAGTVELETTTLSDLTSVSDELFAVEVSGADLKLELGRGTISGSMLERVSLQKCGSLLMAGSSVARSTFVACGEKLRADRGVISGSVLTGAIESHLMIWDNDTFGIRVPSSLESWTDTLSNNRFCAGTSSLSLGDLSGAICNICDELPLAPAQLFCAAVEMDPTLPTDAAQDHVLLAEGNPECPRLEDASYCSPQPTLDNPY
ncbi:MAG: hypothetical protein JWN48_2222 [Myxococcaceae bacterium]|nr:hypothetical protein [Myxococcaceae bacterium]